MSKFKVGDKVVATTGMPGYFETGAKGAVVKVDQSLRLVAFTEGDYKKDKGFQNKKGQWRGHSDNMKLLEDTNTQSKDGYSTTLQVVEKGQKKMQEGYGNFIEGDGCAIQAWAVVADVVTMGGALTDKEVPYTADDLEKVFENVKESV